MLISRQKDSKTLLHRMNRGQKTYVSGKKLQIVIFTPRSNITSYSTFLHTKYNISIQWERARRISHPWTTQRRSFPTLFSTYQCHGRSLSPPYEHNVHNSKTNSSFHYTDTRNFYHILHRKHSPSTDRKQCYPSSPSQTARTHLSITKSKAVRKMKTKIKSFKISIPTSYTGW